MLQVIKSKNRRRLRRKRNPLMKKVDVIKPGGDVRVTSTPAKKGNGPGGNGGHTYHSVSHKKIERPMSSTPPSSPPSGPTKMVLSSGNSPGNSPILSGMSMLSSSSVTSLLTPHMTSLSLSTSSAAITPSIASPLVHRSLNGASAPSTVSPYASAISSTPIVSRGGHGHGHSKILTDMKKKSLSSPLTTHHNRPSSSSSISNNSNRHNRKGSSKISLDEFLNESNDDRRARQLHADEEEAVSSSSDHDDYDHNANARTATITTNHGHYDESSQKAAVPQSQSQTSNTGVAVVAPVAASMERSVSNDQIMVSRDGDSKDVAVTVSLSPPSPSSSSTSTSSSSSSVSVSVSDTTSSSVSVTPMSIAMPVSPVITPESRHAPLRLQRMEHLLRHCRAGSLVAFDLDDTIHQSKYHPSWLMTTPGVSSFQQCMKTNERYASLPLATKNTMIRRLQTSLQDKRLCENNIAWVIRELQEAGCRVFALTARYAEMAPATIRALRSLGIDFATSAPFPAGAIRDPETEALCDDGIIYTNATDKGNVLNRFLHYVALPFLAAESAAAAGIVPSPTSPPPLVLPGEIVFVDDRLSNCRSVLAGLPVANQLNVPIISYHYQPAPATLSSAMVPSPYAVGDDEHDEDEPAAITEIPADQLPLLDLQINHFMEGGPVLTNDEARALLVKSSVSSSAASSSTVVDNGISAPSTPLSSLPSPSAMTCSASVASSGVAVAVAAVRVK